MSVTSCPLGADYDGSDCDPQNCDQCVEDAAHENAHRLFDEMPDSDYYGG